MSLSGPTEFEAVAAESGLTGGLGPESDHTSADPQGAIAGRSLASIAWRRLRRDKVALVAGGVIILIILIAALADVISAIYGQRPSELHNTGADSVINDVTGLPNGPFSGISSTFLLGVTPLSGQDILTNLIYGARTSLSVSFLATALSLVLGISLGLIAGYYRGWADTLISRVMDVLLSFPTLLFSIALITVVSYINSDPSLRYWIIVFVLGFFAFPYIGRIVRGQTISLREREYVEAARSLGARRPYILFTELLPNLMAPILVYATLIIPTNILFEAALSFLGVGVPPPTATWGGMLSDAVGFYTVPHFMLWPGLAIFATVMAFNLFGDGLRDAFDPRSR